MPTPLTSESERPADVPTPVAIPLSGCKATLAALFEAEESAILNFAIGLVGQRSVAEELVQEAFLRLHQLWDQVENPRGWLYRSLRNLALNHLRDHVREIPAAESDHHEGSETPPDVALGRLEAVGMVRLLLAELPAEDQALIRLKYQDDLKYQDISQRTGLSVSHVGYKLHHLLKGLADALRHAGIDGSLG